MIKKVTFILRTLALISILFLTITSYSQHQLDFLGNIDKIVDVPQSPEVASFEKYGNLPVNFYAGAPEISIPVFTHTGKEMNFPISLTYDATGIKVEQMATNVGLGWNLNFGGVVSREVKHLPDDLSNFSPYDGGSFKHQLISDAATRTLFNTIKNNNITSVFGMDFPNQTVTSAMSDFYMQYLQSLIDIHPDEFNFNVNGLSGKVFINYDEGIAYCVSDPNIKVQYSTATFNNIHTYINGWVITDTNGIKYTFEKAEYTDNQIAERNPSPLEDHYREYKREYTSAWYLTRIESPNGFDVYELEYSPGEYWDTELRTKSSYHSFSASKQYQSSTQFTLVPHFDNPASNIYRKYQFHLQQIKYNTITIFSTETADREDLRETTGGSSVKRYTRFKIHNAYGQVTEKMDLLQDYFKYQPSQTNNWENSRLKLNGLAIYNTDISEAKRYSFNYIEPNSMPKITSYGQDFWGYYNGQDSNQHLVSKTLDLNTTSPGAIGWANRTPNFSSTQIGTLNRIGYPTGGQTTFYYEAHKGFGTDPDAINGIVGGLRIYKQESETLDSGDISKITKHYYYNDAHLSNPANLPVNYAPSARIHQRLEFWKQTTIELTELGQGSQPGHPDKFYFLSQNRFFSAPNHVAYTHVSEIEFVEDELNGYTVYEFHNDFLAVGIKEEAFFLNDKPSNGKLYRKSIYDKNKNLKLQSKNEYSNVEIFLNHTEGHGMRLMESTSSLGGDRACATMTNTEFFMEIYLLAGCPNNNAHPKYYGKPYSVYNIGKYNYERFYWSKLEETIEESYFTGNPNAVTSTTTYAYTTNRLTSEIEKIHSNSEHSKTEVYYPQDASILVDYPYGNNALQRLVDRNSLNVPVEVKNYRNNELVGVQRKLYNRSGGTILPTAIQAAKGTHILENKVFFLEYDIYGNPKTIAYPEAPKKRYGWGYNGQHVLFQIENSPATLPANATTKINQIINSSNTIPQNPVTQMAELISLSNELRTLLPGAEITSYTHKPGIGVTSITDAKGDTVYFDYDSNNRLKIAKDSETNKLAEYQYNYRINN